jgi:hypothetical protein
MAWAFSAWVTFLLAVLHGAEPSVNMLYLWIFGDNVKPLGERAFFTALSGEWNGGQSG